MAASARQHWRSLARNRDFTGLWLSQTISEVGSRVSTFVYPLLGYALTGSTVRAAAVEAAYLLGMVGTLVPAGLLADRLDRRWIMRTSAAIGTALYGSLVVAGVLGALTIGHLLGVALVTGIVAGLFAPAEMSAIGTVVEPAEMATAMSQQQARQHVAGLVGAPLGGLLYGITRWLPFLFDAVSYAVAWACLGRIRTDLSARRGGAVGPAVRPLRDVREGLAFTWSQPYLRVLLLWSPLVNLTMNALFLVAVLRLVQEGTAPTAIALVEVVGGLCGIAGAALAPWLIDRLPTGRLTVVIAWSMLPLMVPMAFWGQPPVVAAALGSILLLNPAGNAGVSSYRMAITPPALIGRVQSAMQFTAMATMPLAPVLAGALLNTLGGRDAILALTGLTTLVALIPTLSRAVRSVPRPAQWERHTRLQSVTVTPRA
jgi:predicted MFS family arabinose efflux permease